MHFGKGNKVMATFVEIVATLEWGVPGAALHYTTTSSQALNSMWRYLRGFQVALNERDCQLISVGLELG